MEANCDFSIKIKEKLLSDSLSDSLSNSLSDSLSNLPSYLTYSFRIGYNNDHYILSSIKNFFNISVNIRRKNKTFFYLEIYKIEDLKKIINHCKLYPLLGEKSQSLDKFINIFHK